MGKGGPSSPPKPPTSYKQAKIRLIHILHPNAWSLPWSQIVFVYFFKNTQGIIIKIQIITHLNLIVWRLVLWTPTPNLDWANNLMTLNIDMKLCNPFHLGDQQPPHIRTGFSIVRPNRWTYYLSDNTLNRVVKLMWIQAKWLVFIGLLKTCFEINHIEWRAWSRTNIIDVTGVIW